MTTKVKWVTRWRYEISARPALPGVWRRREGGWVVRGKAKDPRTGKVHQLFKVLDAATATEARAWLDAEQRRIREGTQARAKPVFSDYATSVVARKVADGRIKSAHTRSVVTSILERHLFPALGLIPIDQIRRADIMAWRDAAAAKIRSGEVSPRTASSWWRILRATINEAIVEHELPVDPCAKLGAFDASEHPVYTHEEPNALTADEARRFVAKFRELHPQHFAMVVLGLATGLRPSSLRPLRRKGPNADVLWDEGVLLVRRSHTEGDETMNCTKTGTRQRIALPPELVELLRAHAAALPAGLRRDSDLLFPGRDGTFLWHGVLSEPFAEVARACGIAKRITPRALRRTFQDITRAQAVDSVVVRSISGHASREMQEHYSTAQEHEQRGALAKVVDLAVAREAMVTARGAEGVNGGVNAMG